MLSELYLLAPAAIAVAIVLFLSRRRRAAPARADGLPPNAIVVDGSNILHWGGDPSLKTLKRVLAAVKAHGYAPIVFFDANVGYKVSNRYLNAGDLAPRIGIGAGRIFVVDRGVVADEMILTYARDHQLRVVSNDRFRDWRGQFPMIAKKRMLVGGDWKSGNPVLRF